MTYDVGPLRVDLLLLSGNQDLLIIRDLSLDAPDRLSRYEIYSYLGYLDWLILSQPST